MFWKILAIRFRSGSVFCFLFNLFYFLLLFSHLDKFAGYSYKAAAVINVIATKHQRRMWTGERTEPVVWTITTERTTWHVLPPLSQCQRLVAINRNASMARIIKFLFQVLCVISCMLMGRLVRQKIQMSLPLMANIRIDLVLCLLFTGELRRKLIQMSQQRKFVHWTTTDSVQHWHAAHQARH